MGREDEIKFIAYNIWEEEGCPDGNDCEHWVRAEAIWEEKQKPKELINKLRVETRQAGKRNKSALAAKKK